MSKTEVSGKQLKDGSVEHIDLSPALAGDITTLQSDVATLQTDVATKVDGSTLAAVATSGSYNDLTGAPMIPDISAVEADVSALDLRVDTLEADVVVLQNTMNDTIDIGDLSGVAITSPSSGQVLKYDGIGWANAADSTFSGSYDDLTNKPTLATVATSGSYNDLSDKPAGGGASSLDELSDVAITSAAKGQFIVHNGTSFVNSTTIEAATAATKALIVKGAASQSANLFEIQNSSATALISISSLGQTNLAGGGWNSCSLAVTGAMDNSPTFANAGMYVGVTGGYTFMKLQGSNTAIIDFQGVSTNNWNCRLIGNYPGAGCFGIGTSNSANSSRDYVAKFGGWDATYPAAQFETKATTAKGLVVKAIASQTANLFEVQNSAGTAVVSFTNAGAASFSSNITTTGAINFGPTGISTLTTSGSYNGVALGRGSSTGESGLALGSYQTVGSNAMSIGWGGGGTGRIITGLSSGEVGIGVSSPGAQLHLQPKTAAMKGLIVKGATSQTANLFEAQLSDGTAKMYVRNDGTMVVNGTGTSNAYALNVVTDLAGGSCIGLQHSAASSRYLMAFYNASASLIGSITHDGSTTSYSTSSDYRLKENFVPLSNALDRVVSLPIYRYNFISNPENTVDGCKAHDVAVVCPEAVSGDKDAVHADGSINPQGVDYSKLVPLLLAAVQELKAKNDVLEARIVELESK